MTTPKWSCFKLVTIEADGDYPVYIELSRGLWKCNGAHIPEVIWDEEKCIKTGGEGKEKYVVDPILHFAMNAFKKGTSELMESLYCVDWSAKEIFDIATCPNFEGTERRKTAKDIPLGIYHDLAIASNAKMRRGDGSISSRQASSLSFSKDMESCEVTYHVGSAQEIRELKYENISGVGGINFKFLAREKKAHFRVATSGGLQQRTSITEPPANPPPPPPGPEQVTTGCSCTIL